MGDLQANAAFVAAVAGILGVLVTTVAALFRRLEKIHERELAALGTAHGDMNKVLVDQCERQVNTVRENVHFLLAQIKLLQENQGVQVLAMSKGIELILAAVQELRADVPRGYRGVEDDPPPRRR